MNLYEFPYLIIVVPPPGNWSPTGKHKSNKSAELHSVFFEGVHVKRAYEQFRQWRKKENLIERNRYKQDNSYTKRLIVENDWTFPRLGSMFNLGRARIQCNQAGEEKYGRGKIIKLDT
mgnify:CR=1 FL=1